MIGFQTAFLQQFLNIPKRQRIPKIPVQRDGPELEHRLRRT
jgi:hypothetical protein